jgi:hypothetical protein
MSAGGTGGVGGRREKTTAWADEWDSRCGARAATLTDEELEGEPEALEAFPPILEGRSAATAGPACAPGSPYASHERARLDEAVIRPGGGFWVRQAPCGSACITESRRSKGGSSGISETLPVPGGDRAAALWCNLWPRQGRQGVPPREGRPGPMSGPFRSIPE